MKTTDLFFQYSIYLAFLFYTSKKIFDQYSIHFYGESIDKKVRQVVECWRISRSRHFQLLAYQMARSIDCFQSIISDWDDYQLWDHFEAIVNYCSPRRHLAINRYQNFDEFKYFRRPVSFRDEHAKCVKYPEKAPAKYWQTPNHNCTIVTLGIGRDVVAERQLKSDHPQCRFVGADPVQFINEVLYREVRQRTEKAPAMSVSRSANIIKLLLGPGMNRLRLWFIEVKTIRKKQWNQWIYRTF